MCLPHVWCFVCVVLVHMLVIVLAAYVFDSVSLTCSWMYKYQTAGWRPQMHGLNSCKGTIGGMFAQRAPGALLFY